MVAVSNVEKRWSEMLFTVCSRFSSLDGNHNERIVMLIFMMDQDLVGAHTLPFSGRAGVVAMKKNTET